MRNFTGVDQHSLYLIDIAHQKRDQNFSQKKVQSGLSPLRERKLFKKYAKYCDSFQK